MVRNLIEDYKRREAEIVTRMANDLSLAGELTYLDKDYRVTVVSATDTKINDKGLRHVLSPEQWEAVTNRKLDRKKLDKLIDNGTIDAELVSDFVTVVQKSPYVRITELKAWAEDDSDV